MIVFGVVIGVGGGYVQETQLNRTATNQSS